MKTKTYKTLTLAALCTVVFSFNANAQLPDFTKVDTGAITQLWGGHGISTCFDMDNDGDLDLFAGNSGVFADRVFSTFKNESNGFFIEMPAFITNLDDKMLSSFGDIDNDGDEDLFVGRPYSTLKIYTNNGYGNFQFDNSIYSLNSEFYPALLDLNNDGFLDAVTIDKWGKVSYNNGNGVFQGSTSLGLFQVQKNVILHGISWGDVDNDGDLDFYGGYSPTPENGIPINLCYINNGDGSFTQFDPTSIIVGDSCSTPCVNWVDYDNDGDMDLYVHNVLCDNSLPALFENLGDMQFTRHDIIDEIYRYSFANSAVWGDLDNDADLDLYITIENNEFPFPPGGTSATPFNVIYLNDGNGQFTNYLEEHPLVLEDSHTALLFDHDNDGDLDVLMTRYSWSNDGYNNLFVNQGNDNSWIVLTCEGTTSNRSAIGTRIQAKAFVNGKHITQTREITPINGHLSYANLRVHFGLDDTDVIDTLIIRWPSGLVDEYLNVKANQFYRAIENDKLEIDFRATNYIEYSPAITEKELILEEDKITIDLNEHYHFMKGDTVPEINGDTLIFSIYENINPDVVSATLDGNILTLTTGTENGDSKIQLKASAGFTERVDHFNVKMLVDVEKHPVKENLKTYPNPFTTSTSVQYELTQPSTVHLTIYDYLGKQVEVIEQHQTQGKQQIIWNAEGLQAGVYFCVLKTEYGRQTMKIIKL